MLEVPALQFTRTFPQFSDFLNEEKVVLVKQYNYLLDITDENSFDNTYGKTYGYVMQIIYNYYDCYYLSSATKSRFLTLLGTIISGKLPFYKVMYENYLKSKDENLKAVSGRKSTSSGSSSDTLDSDTTYSSKQRYANTPENVDSNIDYVEEYSTSQGKVSNQSKGKKVSSGSMNKSYNETIEGGYKDLWTNIERIPQTIYKEVITITAKLFFSETMEERAYPLAYLTLTRRVQDLGSAKIVKYESILEGLNLVSTITTENSEFKTSVPFNYFENQDLEDSNISYDETNHAIKYSYTLKGGNTSSSYASIPMASLNNDGFMSKVQFKKLDDVILYGTSYQTTGENYGVRKDSNNNLYVIVPKGQIAIASATDTGAVKLYANQLDNVVETTLYSSDLKVPVQMDAQNRIFVEVPNYILPEASIDNYGGVKLFAPKRSESLNLTPLTSGENLPIEIDASGKMFVNNGIKKILKLYDKEELSGEGTNRVVLLNAHSTTISADLKCDASFNINMDENDIYFNVGNWDSYVPFFPGYYAYKFNPVDDKPFIVTKNENGNYVITSTSDVRINKGNDFLVQISQSSFSITIDVANHYAYVRGSVNLGSGPDETIYIKQFSISRPYSPYISYVVIDGKAYQL